MATADSYHKLFSSLVLLFRLTQLSLSNTKLTDDGMECLASKTAFIFESVNIILKNYTLWLHSLLLYNQLFQKRPLCPSSQQGGS